jgi:two-component system nitrate/nitrite response regulator NarL
MKSSETLMAAKPAAARILLVDDHALFRESLVRLLEADPAMEVVAHCSTTEDALRLVKETSPTLILLDYDLGGQKAPQILRRLKETSYPGRVLILTAGVNDNESRELLALGASGIFLKHDSADLLARCVEKIMSGEIWLSQRFLRALIHQSPARQESRTRTLTEREREVLRGLLEGLANKEIGVRLNVSESTVKSAMQQLFQKLGVRTRSQLVRVTLEQYMDQL